MAKHKKSQQLQFAALDLLNKSSIGLNKEQLMQNLLHAGYDFSNTLFDKVLLYIKIQKYIKTDRIPCSKCCNTDIYYFITEIGREFITDNDHLYDNFKIEELNIYDNVN